MARIENPGTRERLVKMLSSRVHPFAGQAADMMLPGSLSDPTLGMMPMAGFMMPKGSLGARPTIPPNFTPEEHLAQLRVILEANKMNFGRSLGKATETMGRYSASANKFRELSTQYEEQMKRFLGRFNR